MKTSSILSGRRSILLLTLFALHIGAIAPGAIGAVNGQFTQVGDLAATRWSPGVVLLPDGRLLLAGGIWIAGYGLRDAELFDPATASWTATGEMGLPRYGHGMAALQDGRALVFGGVAGTDCASNEFSGVTEIWDPVTGLFTSTGTKTLVPRVAPIVVTLDDGRVLAAGGWDRCGTVYRSAEVFDPATSLWTAAGDMNVARHAAGSLLLPDGRVLVAGGIENDASPALASAEIYDPVAGTWSLTGTMVNARYWGSDDDAGGGTLVQLPDGKVLAAGGTYRDCNNWFTCSRTYISAAETYDPATAEWSATGSMAMARGALSTALLGDGTVLAVGGYDGANTLSSAEIYDPLTGSWAFTAEMIVARSETAALPLPDGSALVTAGYSGYHDLASTEVFSLGGTLNQVFNAGFESGSGIAWTESSDDNFPLVTRDLPRTSEFSSRLGARDNAVDYVEQQIRIPRRARLRVWTYISSTDSLTQANDFLNIALYRPNGTLLRTLRTKNNTSPRNEWVSDTIDLSRIAGQTLKLRFSATTNTSNPTTFYVDDITLK
jgi:hypothetical protein